MDQSAIRAATPADRDQVIESVVAAFDQDPAFRYFFADTTTFAEQAAVFAAYLFDKRVARGTVWIVDGGRSVALWDGPVRVGAEATPVPELLLPDDSLARLNAYDAAVHGALPTEPHWYLGVLATHPSAAGRRWGRAVMAEGLRRAATDRLPAYLETTNPGNVELYQRSGWHVTAESKVGNVAVWVMAQSPA